MESIHVEASIVEYCSQIETTMIFTNKTSHPLESVFFFPMNEQAAVCGFGSIQKILSNLFLEAQIGEKRIIGQIQTKEKAFNMYTDAISKGDGAYLLEQESPTLVKGTLLVFISNYQSLCWKFTT